VAVNQVFSVLKRHFTQYQNSSLQDVVEQGKCLLKAFYYHSSSSIEQVKHFYLKI